MHDKDNILEAEQSIQNIAAELSKMRDAAILLQEAQIKSEGLISAAQIVIQSTELFSKECGTIVSKLSSTDLSQKLDSLEKLHDELADTKTDLAEKIGVNLKEIRKYIQTLSDASHKTITEEFGGHTEKLSIELQDRSKALLSEISKLSAQLATLKNSYSKDTRGAKVRSIVIMIFAILGFLSALGALIMQLMKQG